MLSQMPTSALSFLSSSSKGLDGFFGLISVGIQSALTVVLAEFNTEFTTAVRATATVKLVLQPTKCVISNGTGFHPYVATMGSATIVLLVVSFMLLRAKGRDIGAGDPASLPSADKTEPHSGGQPPSPPEDPETESGAKKRRNRWPFVLLYLLIVTVLLSLGAAFFSVHLIRSHRLVVPHPIAYGLLAIEGGSSYIWIVAVSAFSLYRRPVLLALASHLVCITLKLALRRAWPHLRPFLGDDAIGCIWVPLAINIISSRLNWVYGMPYYHHGYSVVFTMTQSLNRLFASGLKFLARFEPSDDLTFIVPLVFHAATTVLFACLSGIRAILYSSNENRLLHVIGWPMRCAFFTAFFFVPQAMLQLLCGFIDLAPNLKIRIFIAPFSRASREKIRAAFWGRYPRWHSVESKGLSRLKSELFHLFMRAVWWCWGVWCTLSWAQKLLIIAPAAIFYAFHIVQWARGCWRRRSQSRERWRRGLVDD